MAKTNLNWNQRFALIDHYKPTDAQICTAFDVEQKELDTARSLRNAGQFIASSNLDVESYSSLFAAPTPTVTSVATPKSDAPLTATKAIKVPKKRGRKGDKIKNAFAAIPTDATPAEDFAVNHGVSLTVLRQGKRFDPQPGTGKVHVKKVAQDSGEKVLCIWRDK